MTAPSLENDSTLQWVGRRYRIERQEVVPGLCGTSARAEKRLDGSLAMRHGERYLAIQECALAYHKPAPPAPPRKAAQQP